jgi:hypothetical protein
VLYFVTSLLHSSTLLQDILIQTVCNGGLGYLGVLLIQLWMVNPWLSVVTVLVGLLCLHFVFKMSSGGLSKKLSGGVSDKLIYPETSSPAPSAKNVLEAAPEESEAESLGSDDDDDDQDLSFGDISVSDSNDDSSGVPSLGQVFVFDSRSQHSSEDSQGSDDDESSLSSSEADEFSVRVKLKTYFDW